ncbi:Uncharacterized protein conserved in bacteria [Phocoenobacter uteri]|uniref:Uncharacterized protein conserved in bacteria n=1 Tax=Phocoenobacter uteri TaxID=146806 RepID=A0A379CCN2_9PAST|nr:ExeM/NucH family extracellular endonuclease [Phocoenobacter uteri]MDG6881465.1 hypothetical protein [Phocoenobacter uteri]SUB59495.1 Uncharacterized protein conserved in bacteria [Phocoenobacter uteri]
MRKNLLSLAVSSAILVTGCSVQPTQVIPSSIQQLQGSGAFSPMVDVQNKIYQSKDTYRVEGVITAIQHKSLGKDLKVGFFMQAPSDNNPKTSDGIFVETTNLDDLKVGNLVSLQARVAEDYKWTKLVDVSDIKVLKTNVDLPKPEVLRLDSSDMAQSLERYEGMLVRVEKSSDLFVTKNFGFDYGAKRNNLALSYKHALLHPNQLTAPSTKKKIDNENALVVESFEAAPRGEIVWYPTFGESNGKESSDNYIRINDLVDGLEGVIGYSYGQYRLYVTNEANSKNFIHTQDRQAQPQLKKGGDLRIASFNVLNYFNSPYSKVKNPLHQNRGAKTEEEFKLQSGKIATAIANMNADIVGLMEIENNGFDQGSAVEDLVKQINSKIKDPKEHYAYVKPSDNSQFIGGDAISNQLLYKKDKVTLTNYRIIKMPTQYAPDMRYKDGYRDKFFSGTVHQRDTVAVTFKVNKTNKDLTVAVNHLKSKGSACWEDVQTGRLVDADNQGSCENLRVAGADVLGQELSKIQGAKVILGDLNSYGNEDPIMVLTNRHNAPKDHVIKTSAYTYIGSRDEGTPLYGKTGKVIDHSYGYTNIVAQLHPKSYSFSFKNHIGTLDYILVSKDMLPSVVDATDWNINAGESTLFEYANKYNCKNSKQCSHRYYDIYRASDHDPAVMDLDTRKLK